MRLRDLSSNFFYVLPHGILLQDTFKRVFAQLYPKKFQASFIRWMSGVSSVIGGLMGENS
jgi:hypothetical protein